MADGDPIRAFEHAGWERAAATYEGAFATATRQFVGALLDAAGVGAGRQVLDVACGPGFVAAAAAERGAVARGLDFSAAMLAVARARHPAVAFDQGDAEALAYADGAFDAVVSNFGIHHLPSPLKALGETYRVLRPSGRLAFTIWGAPVANIGWKLIFDAIRRHGDMAASHAPAAGGGFATSADCSTALEQAGFIEIGTKKLTGIWRHTDGAALLRAMQAGTARMAALIDAQRPQAMAAITADIDSAASVYRDADGLAIPLAAIVASGRKPPA